MRTHTHSIHAHTHIYTHTLCRDGYCVSVISKDRKSAGMLNRIAALPFLVLAVSCASAARLPLVETPNDRPVIGILTQEVNDSSLRLYGRTYIPSSYVKYIESGGARVIPIRLNQTREEHEKIFRSVNGLIFIGGAVDLETSDFAHTAGLYFRLALQANNEGDYFPIWGTCMGFQLLTVQVAGENLLSKTMAENISMPLNLTSEAQSSRMFASFPPELFKALSEEPLTGNFHHYGITEQVFVGNEKLSSFFTILSTNKAENGAVFVSTMEGKKYPFYGVQWHPEVNRFQWDPHYSFPHSKNAVQVSSLLAQFLVNEGRRSSHHFSQPEEETRALIYNYNPVYTANFSSYEQVYFF
ncbi:gamma-glutamyl hydrolase [Tachysurus vachellii]|uniref:gamma-glutamyl hydrolase n=1 Tax=Tachysurus vachellii TaxID=175792 RepID=UPI00296AD548|nr:gamma-glutamyl hydrolase [Tachysurus vachellii]